MSQTYPVILVTLFISFYFFLLIILMVCVFFLLWLTSYNYVIHAYCVLFAILWVDGVDVYNVGSPLFVCACFVSMPVCVLHAGCLNDNW